MYKICLGLIIDKSKDNYCNFKVLLIIRRRWEIKFNVRKVF